MMKLGTAVTILSEVYKPISQWSDSLEIPRDLPKNETIQEAWSVVVKFRRKHARTHRTSRVYHSKNFDKILPRRDELIEDIKSGMTLWELDKKYDVINIYQLFTRLDVKWIYQRYAFLKRCVYAIKDGKVMVFDNIEKTCRHFKIGNTNFDKKYIRNGKTLQGYRLYRYKGFIKVYSDHDKIFEEIIQKNNI